MIFVGINYSFYYILIIGWKFRFAIGKNVCFPEVFPENNCIIILTFRS